MIKDLARWGFWVPLRDYLDPSNPSRLHRLFPMWRLHRAIGGSQADGMREEYKKILPWLNEEQIDEIVDDAYRVAFRVHLEELLMGKLTNDTVPNFLDVRGWDNLEKALEKHKGAIILSAHAGSFMLPIAALSLAGFPYTQYAARGMPPQEVAQEHPEVLKTNKWVEQTRKVREENEDRLPARFVTLNTSTRELYRRLSNNELVALAFDGRIGNKWVRTNYLGREAILNSGAYRLSHSTKAPIVPTFCRTPKNGISICELKEPIYPESRNWQDLMKLFLEQANQWILRYPSEYGTWLAHCRLRNAIDDHPLFIDQAIDDRWKKHPLLDLSR